MDSGKGEQQIKEINVESRTIIDEKDREIARLKDMLNEARKQNIEKDRRIDNLNQLVDRMKDIIESNTSNINRQLEDAMSDLFGRVKKDSFRVSASKLINNPVTSQQQLQLQLQQQQQQQPVPELHLFPKNKINTAPIPSTVNNSSTPVTASNNNSVKLNNNIPLAPIQINSVKNSKGTSSPDRSPSSSDLKFDKLTPKSMKIPVAKKSLSVGAITSPASEESVPRYTRLEDFIGRIYTLSKNQAASRFLQKKIG